MELQEAKQAVLEATKKTGCLSFGCTYMGGEYQL